MGLGVGYEFASSVDRFFLCLYGAIPAKATLYLYEINASYSSGASTITGSFTWDDSIGPASISNVAIQATLPTTAGPFNLNFDQVLDPAGTWNAFGGSSPYLWFANSAFAAGDTHFWMGVKYDANANDGSYRIGIWGNPGNPHPSEISVINVKSWQGIEGRMTREIAPAVPEPSTWAMLLIGFAAIGFVAYRKRRGERMLLI